MADVVKRVNRALPPGERYQVFTEADASAGDVILVKDSLGGVPASHVTIEAVAAMTVRFNVYQTLYPQRGTGDGMYGDQWGAPNVSKGVAYKDDSQGPISVAAGGTLELDDDVPVSDIEVVTAGGAFTITCL